MDKRGKSVFVLSAFGPNQVIVRVDISIIAEVMEFTINSLCFLFLSLAFDFTLLNKAV